MRFYFFEKICNIMQSALAMLDYVLYNDVDLKFNTYLSILIEKLIAC